MRADELLRVGGSDESLPALVDYHLAALRAAGRAPDTLVKYAQAERLFCRYLEDTLGRVPLAADLNLKAARAFLAWLEDEHTPAGPGGRDRRHGPLNVAFYGTVLKAWAGVLTEECGLYPKGHPLARLRVPRPPDAPVTPLSRAQFDHLVALAASTREPLRNRALLLFLVDTGCRISEALALDLADVELATAQRHGRALVRGKGNKKRYVHFGGATSKALGAYIQRERRTRPGEHALWTSQRRTRLTDSAVQGQFHELGRQSGIRGVRISPHTLRHTFATWFLQRHPGCLEQLRQLLGHANLTQVLTYARVASADVEDVYDSALDRPAPRRDFAG